MSSIINVSPENTITFIDQMENFYQISGIRQSADTATTYRFDEMKITITYYHNSNRLLFQGAKQMMSHLINWFEESIKRDINNTEHPNISNSESSNKKRKTTSVHNTLLHDNSITNTNISLLKTQLFNIIQNWNSMIPQTTDKETQTYDDF